MDVPSSIRSVCSAARAKGRNGSCDVSDVPGSRHIRCLPLPALGRLRCRAGSIVPSIFMVAHGAERRVPEGAVALNAAEGPASVLAAQEPLQLGRQLVAGRQIGESAASAACSLSCSTCSWCTSDGVLVTAGDQLFDLMVGVGCGCLQRRRVYLYVGHPASPSKSAADAAG